MVHITQSERIIIGLDGNLYFSNLVESDSREDYICNAQYAAARTILPVTAVNLTVMPSKCPPTQKCTSRMQTNKHTKLIEIEFFRDRQDTGHTCRIIFKIR